jgi:hypothetical protein
MGGLAIRKASEVAVPAYLSSVCATSKGVEAMVSNTIFEETNPFLESAQQRWLDMAGPHTGISCQNFFHSTIIPLWKVSWVSREGNKVKEL